jgi:hypothetical protein
MGILTHRFLKMLHLFGPNLAIQQTLQEFINVRERRIAHTG